jgi:hypothetical protein
MHYNVVMSNNRANTYLPKKETPNYIRTTKKTWRNCRTPLVNVILTSLRHHFLLSFQNDVRLTSMQTLKHLTNYINISFDEVCHFPCHFPFNPSPPPPPVSTSTTSLPSPGTLTHPYHVKRFAPAIWPPRFWSCCPTIPWKGGRGCWGQDA